MKRLFKRRGIQRFEKVERIKRITRFFISKACVTPGGDTLFYPRRRPADPRRQSFFENKTVDLRLIATKRVDHFLSLATPGERE